MQTAKRLNGIGEYYFSAKLREIDQLNKAGKAVINLGIGSPDLPPHPEVIRVLQEASAQPENHAYQGYKGIPQLRKAMADWYSRAYRVELDPETEVLPLIGSKEGIMHICMTYLNEGDQALIPDPGYPTYSSAVKLAGGTPVPYELSEERNWQPNFEELEKQDLSRVRLMWVNYPHMPTGQLPDQNFFVRLIEFGKKHNMLICHDNPYSFILNENPVSLLAIPGAKDVVLELNSLSKSHNMAGWRVGMLAGNPKRIQEVLTFKSNMDSGMFKPLQLAAAAALNLGKEWHDELNRQYRERQQKVFGLMELLGCRYNIKQAGMFVWASIPDSYKDCYELSDAVLNEASVFITPGGIFGKGGNRYIRISLCSTPEKLEEARQRIETRFTKR